MNDMAWEKRWRPLPVSLAKVSNYSHSVITESGLYSAVLGSKAPDAKTFKRWLTHEVLPSIRIEKGSAPQPPSS